MRIRGAKTELEEAGESTDGMAESTASLRQEMLALSGVDIMLDKNTFKSTYQIMDELSRKWKDLTDIQQATIIELVAGKHQGNIFSSLMANFQTARDALTTSLTSSGSAMAEHAKWSESLEARLNKLKATWQSLSQTFMNSDFLKVTMDLITGLVDILDKLIGNLGLLGTTGLGVAIFNVIKHLKDFTNIQIFSTLLPEAKSLGGAFKALGYDLSKFIKTSAGVTSAISLVVAAVGLAYNAYKKVKEEAAEARQEIIESSNEYLDAASNFEQAYIKYSGRTDLTAEEEAELESAINGTVDALGEKSSALQSIVNSSNDYLASLEAIKKAELDAAKRAAEEKRDNAAENLKEAAIGWESFDGSEVNVQFTTMGYTEEAKIAKEMNSEFFASGARGGAVRIEGFKLSGDADINTIIDYYNTLLDYQKRLSDADLKDSVVYDRVTAAIAKMSEAIGVYVDGTYEAIKANYQLDNTIPKTVDDYIKMREAILQSDDVKNLSFDQKLGILNALDSEYGKLFDLSDAMVQARKFVGIIEGYGDGKRVDEVGTVETFLNMRTAVNNNECTVGEYLSKFYEIQAMTLGWSDKEKEEFNLSFGLDTDSIKEQYQNAYNYIYRNYIKNLDTTGLHGFEAIQYKTQEIERVKSLLNGLTATELQAVINLKTEIDWENTSFDEILKQIKEEANLIEALNFSANIEIDTTALEMLNKALSESASAIGLTSESIDSLNSRYSELEGYDSSVLFEKTANGVKLNREELAKLEKKYNDLNKSKVQKHIDSLTEAYNENAAAIDKCKNVSKRAQLIAENETYKNKIEELATYQAQLEGVTGAYQRWIDAQNTPEDYEGYQAVATSREDIKDEIKRGFISNASKEYIDLLSGKDLTGGTIDDYANAWEKLGEKVTSTGYSIHDFFTVNDDGDITATGIDRFMESVKKEFDDIYNSDTGIYDFSQENLKKIQDEWGIGIEAIELLLEAAASAGYDVDWSGILEDIDLDTSDFETLVSFAEKAQSELNKLEGYENLRFNFATTSVEDATTEIEKAQSAYSELINKDGKINLKAEGAEQMRVVLSTLLVQKQQLEDSEIALNVSTSGLDDAQAKAVAWVQDFRTKYKNLEIAISTGEGIEEAKTELEKVKTSLGDLDGDTAKIAAQLVLGEDTDTSGDGFKTQVNNAIDSIGKQDIDVGFKLDETDISDLNSQLLTNFTVDATAKITNVDESQLKTVETNGMVNWNENTDNVSKSFEANGTVNWDDNVDNVKKSFSANGTVKWTSGNKVKVDVVSEAAGTAHAVGTTSGRAFARGDWGIKGNGVALGGELAPELLVREGKWHLIGEDGAEFFNYKPNDIIFNAAQTESLFKYGGIKGAKPRGKMLATGSAFADGSSNSRGKAFWQASALTSNFAKRRLRQVTADGDYGNARDEYKKSTTTTTPYATVKDSEYAKEREKEREKSASNSSSSEKEKFEETFDWIETKISRLERAIDQLDKTANNAYKSWSDRNSALTSEISKVGDEIELQQAAYDRYMQEANSVGLSADWASKVRNGEINIDTITDEDLAKKIGEYQDWYDKALACEDAILELKESESELYAQRFENVQSQYDAILQGYEHTEAMLDEYINQAEAKGHIVSREYYDALIENEKSSIAELKREQEALIAERDNAVAEGKIIKGSEAWYEQCAAIDEVTQAIEEANTSIIEYNNSIRDIDWQIFDLMQERISDVVAEADFLIELMSNKMLFEDDGRLTSQGLATMALHGQNYNSYMYAADTYGEEVANLDEQISKDPYDQELINRRNELLELQRESILAAEDEKNAIRDMVEEGINLELDALQERIDKYNEGIDAAKDLYDYQKDVQKQSEEIASLEKQRAAYLGNDSDEGKARLQEIEVSLKEAKENLQETEYDKYISDQQELLDNLYSEYELILNTRLDNIDYLLEGVIESINAIASSDGTIATALGSEGALSVAIGNNATSIKGTLTSEANNVGTTLSAAMNNIWSVGEGNAKSVLTMYGNDFKTKSATIITTLNGIKSGVNGMVSSLNKEAEKKTTANKTATSAKKNPTTSSSSKKTTSATTKKTVGDGNPKIGDKVKFISGQYYYDSQGTKPLGNEERGGYVYITNINKKSWATHPYHIARDKAGKRPLGWLKLSQISGYAVGKQNFLNDEIAWTQEDGKQEFIVRPSDGAILTPIAKGDSVLTSDASSNIWNMANSPAEFIKDSLGIGTANVPNNSTIQSNYTQHIENVVFRMDNVKNYEEMLSAMQKDKNFERLVLSMSIDRIAGKSSLAKGKSIR